MPRYFFDIRDGEFISDEVGLEFPHLEAARLHAVIHSGELLKENPSKFWQGEEWQLEVRDETRALLFILTFMATNAPHLQRSRLRGRVPSET